MSINTTKQCSKFADLNDFLELATVQDSTLNIDAPVKSEIVEVSLIFLEISLAVQIWFIIVKL